MTTKQVTKETKVCDVCASDKNVWTTCLICGRDYCYNCRKDHTVTYPEGVHFSGRDGDYCLSCDTNLLKSGTDRLHTAYLKVKQLRAEETGWYQDFKTRVDAAEKKLKELREGVNSPW